MKVQVNVKVVPNSGSNSSLDLVVGPTDDVASVKTRVATSQLIPFTRRELQVNGQILQDEDKLGDRGVCDGSSLDVVVYAEEDILVQQVSQLLRARDLSVDELSLMYSYKQGVCIGRALQMLGQDIKLKDFLSKQSCFTIDGSTISLLRDDCKLKPFSASREIEKILRNSVSGSMEIQELSAKFAQKFNVSLTSIVGLRPLEFLELQKNLFSVNGKLVSIAPMKEIDPTMGTVRKPVAATHSHLLGAALGTEKERYVDLHERISSRLFLVSMTQTLNRIIEAVCAALFLNVAHVVKGGSIGKGVPTVDARDAEVVFFVKGLPPTGHSKWLPPLLHSASGVLLAQLGAQHEFEKVTVTADSVRLGTKDGMIIDLRFSPVPESYSATIELLRAQASDAKMLNRASFAKERVQFIARQPSHVKSTIRLLKWWRDQRAWTSTRSRPSDEVLELVAVYSAVQTKPSDQRVAIANVMSLLSRFNELRILWSNFYTKSDVWAPLLRQRPLLMDPVNPFLNVADPEGFDSVELVVFASTTDFFT